MGKKSRSKGADKAARKEKLSTRREQQVGRQERARQSADFASEFSNPDEREYFEGDRVWFIDPEVYVPTEPNEYRGIVRGITPDGQLRIISLQSILDGYDGEHCICIVPRNKVFPDFEDFMPRFDVGDFVVCRRLHWTAARIQYLWPIHGIQSLPVDAGSDVKLARYLIKADLQHPSTNMGQIFKYPYDRDTCIKLRPSSFRFKVGDSVDINPIMAEGSNSRSAAKMTKSTTLMRGRITAVDVSRPDVNYAVYECSFGKDLTCRVLDDTDEHISRADADPRARDRLFDAIEQNCRHEHLSFLCSHFDIDVSTFRDLVAAKAIECASLQALSWLQHVHSMDLLSIKDEFGNNILHQIAKTEHANRFIREAGRYSCDQSMQPILDLGRRHTESLHPQLNDDGELWIQSLVKRGDVKALDAALSPHCGFAWELCDILSPNHIQLLGNSVNESGDSIMQCIFDSFLSFRGLYRQSICFEFYRFRGDVDEKVLVDFGWEGTNRSAKALIRFCYDWYQHPSGKVANFNSFARMFVLNGYFRHFPLIYEADEKVLRHLSYRVESLEDKGEFIQRELHEVNNKESDKYIDVDIFTACIIGENELSQLSGRDKWDDFDTDLYMRSIFEHATACDHSECPSLLHHLQELRGRLMKGKESDKYNFNYPMFLKRIALLKDDDNVEGRRKILDYLLCKEPNIEVDMLQPLKHRQCWVLQFLVDKGLLQMDALAIRSRNLIEAAKDLLFLENGRLEDMTVKCCLCFAAVQYDDLQSLEYLCEYYGSPVEMIGGWNLLHFSAYMGRIEIIAWLSSQKVWNCLATQVCARNTFLMALPVHIAASRGHLVACDLMIELKCPLEDGTGRFPEDYAKSSPHQYVLDWAEKRGRPKILEADVGKLFELVRDSACKVEEIKDFIKHSACLDVDAWVECGYLSFDVAGPMGLSFGDVLHECCKSLDLEVVEWICLQLYFCEQKSFLLDPFWGNSEERLTQNDLIDILGEQRHDYLSDLLRKKWFKGVSCEEPLTNGILASALHERKSLEIVRAAILRVHALLEMAAACYRGFGPLVDRGGRVDELEDLISTQSSVIKALIHEGCDLSKEIRHHPSSRYSTYLFEPISMTSAFSSDVTYDEDHSFRKQLRYVYSAPVTYSKLHIVLATEGYAELMSFCLSKLSGWTASMELDVVRISSYLGHSAITEMFLGDGPKTMLSSVEDRYREAIFGAGEALRYRDLEALIERFGGAPSDPIIEKEDLTSSEADEYLQRLGESLIVSLVNGYVRDTSNHDCDDKTTLKTLSFLVDRLGYSHDDILLAMASITEAFYSSVEIRNLLEMSQNVIKVMGFQPIHHHERMRHLCEVITRNVDWHYKDEEVVVSSLLTWLANMADLGIDIQHLKERYNTEKQFDSALLELEGKQKKEWSNFAIVKDGASLNDIQEAVDRGVLRLAARDRGGLLITHLSAAYDRVDLLEWLVDTKGMQLDSIDGDGRTTLEVAEASKALQATKWITERKARDKITSFIRRFYYRALQTRRLKQSNCAATTIQRYVRGHSSRKLYSGALLLRLEESKRFQTIWGHLVGSMAQFSSSWSSIRENFLDIQVGIDDELFDVTDRRLREAVDVAVAGDTEDVECRIDDEAAANLEVLTINDEDSSAKETDASSNEWLSFQMTSHVVKFLQQGDKKYKSFFVRRMQQLARGERSRILKKPLKGSQSHIYETYLEQKSGHRILWTEEGGTIVVWYVAKHKQVSRLMQLIDDSKSRSARQLMPQSLSDELRNEDVVTSDEPKKELLLDIVGNVPMKIYDVSFNTITEIAKDSWTPRLHLTDEERDIVEAEGTVLVLGRSGTGKTVCICNRIECDRQSRAGCDPSFTQLFVARSVRLCKYVEGAVGEDNRTSFCTYSRLLSDIEASLPLQRDGRSYNPSQKMDFHRFKQEFYTNSSSSMKVSALILWTVIRTFLKGSIEAFQSPNGVLPRDDFLEVEKLGKNRCRIPAELREHVYDEFLRYENHLEERKLWDDCARSRHMIIRIEESKKVDPDAFGQVQKSKVYVDEVQDYTQLEILLFFYLSGPNGLFLAGDPAQSVVEGTEFRFEEVRSVGHFIGSVIQKPKTVNINFRSHSGILNCAGGVLDFLFSYFPSSAKQLKKDKGLFQGSRPGVLFGASVDQLNVLLSDKLNGAVILTHDECASHWKRMLNDYKRVYGIREAKGLEFKTVIILDFFRELPSSLQKPWRELVLGRADQDFEYKHPLVGNMLKLLYTGVTRCIEKLFFVETSSSTAGKSTIRWLTKQSPGSEGCFATLNGIDDIEAMSMTADEFVGEGINNAELSESAEDLDEAERYLERAVWCFEQADNADLAAKARMHHSSVLFRRELHSSLHEVGAQNHAVIEMKAANMMGSLCREGLFFEVLNTFYAVRPYLSEYACEQLERGLVAEIRRAEADHR